MPMLDWNVYPKGDSRYYQVAGNSPEYVFDVRGDIGIVTFKDDRGVTTAVFPLAAISAVTRVEVKDGKRTPIQ